ncbi:MAG: hypothetical protein WD772_09315 [Pseudohongiellaceae bacterium]
MPPDRESQAGDLPVPAVPVASLPASQGYLRKLSHFLELGLSIPERSARALSALAGGTTLILAQTLIPSAIRHSNTYRFTVGMFQTFMIRNVAGMQNIQTDFSLPDAFLQRKVLGSGLEAAGLLTMHFSPVWVFALASDTARGSQVFLNRLVLVLKQHEVIPQDSSPQSIEQVLIAIQDMAARGAAAFDMPPMSRDELVRLAEELRLSTANLASRSGAMVPDFEAIWNQIIDVARMEKLSVEEVLGILAINAGKSRGTVEAVGKTGIALMDDLVLKEYRDTLAGIRQTGAVNYINTHMEPFFTNALSHFDFRRPTVTQSWYRRMLGRFRLSL